MKLAKGQNGQNGIAGMLMMPRSLGMDSEVYSQYK
jgi:hypothetical protein